MGMSLFSCLNCKDDTGNPGVRFFAEQPVCPTCKIDGRQPKMSNLVVKCRIVHFDPPHPLVTGMGLNVFACDPTKKIGPGGTNGMASGVPDAVNCPLCRESEAFKATQAKMMQGPDTVNVPAGVVKG